MNSPFGLIQFKGDKALPVLQGQCTQMVSDLSEGYAPLIAFCDPKGRMYGSGRLIIHQGIVESHNTHRSVRSNVARLTPFDAVKSCSRNHIDPSRADIPI